MLFYLAGYPVSGKTFALNSGQISIWYNLFILVPIKVKDTDAVGILDKHIIILDDKIYKKSFFDLVKIDLIDRVNLIDII